MVGRAGAVSAGSKKISPNASGILGEFPIAGVCEGIRPFGGGHINDTFLSSRRDGGKVARYAHQRINGKVFRRPDQVMENIVRVTSHMAENLRASGAGTVERRTATVAPARSGLPWFRDAGEGWWRTYLFIEGTHSRDCVDSAEQAAMLADTPPPRRRQRSFSWQRTGTAAAPEDETDLSLVSFNSELFRALLEGYLSRATSTTRFPAPPTTSTAAGTR